jgi:hypothetical protein
VQETKKLCEKLEKSIELKNGLILELWVKSKAMAGDRWKIGIIAQSDVPVKKALEPNGNALVNIDEIKELLGESVRFEKKMERFFIDEKEKDKITEEIMNSLLETIFPYLSHPQFCKRFIIREFARAKQEKVLSKQLLHHEKVMMGIPKL